MKSYPRFLNSKPTFYGMTFRDIVLFSLVLYLGVFLEFNPIASIVSAGLFIIGKSFLKSNFDFIGLTHFSSQKTIKWFDDYKDIV